MHCLISPTVYLGNDHSLNSSYTCMRYKLNEVYYDFKMGQKSPCMHVLYLPAPPTPRVHRYSAALTNRSTDINVLSEHIRQLSDGDTTRRRGHIIVPNKLVHFSVQSE